MMPERLNLSRLSADEKKDLPKAKYTWLICTLTAWVWCATTS